MRKNTFCQSSFLGRFAGRIKGKTFILFSDDLDKVLATFVLANGAAATGKKGNHLLYFLGAECHQEAGQTCGEERYLGEDVRHDAAFQFFKVEVV